jgi:hypothetical protein
MTNIIALNKITHKQLKISKDASYKHARQQHISMLQVHEFMAASLYYPIVFIKDAETGEFRATAMMGLQPEENLFHHEDGWDALYVPTSVRGYPFLIAPETASLCADLDSPRFSETQGTALFNDDGSDTELLKQLKALLGEFISQTPVSREFTRYLAELNLFSPFNLTITIGEAPYQLNGLYAVDHKKLNELRDADFLSLRKKNYLPAIYAHLQSLNAMEGLVHRKSKLAKKK